MPKSGKDKMPATVSLREKGQITIPFRILNALGWKVNDFLSLELEVKNKIITIKKHSS